VQSKNLAIMFTDIKGYTARTAAQSRNETSLLLEKHRHLVLPIVRAFDGRVIKGIGDAFLVAFPSSTAAVLCGMTIQDRLYKYNVQLPENEQIHLRVAINTGEVLNIKGDVYGETVNVAARVEGITPANEVYFTEAVYLTMNKSEVTAVKVGQFDLKGIPYPVAVYRVPSALDVKEKEGAAGDATAVDATAVDASQGHGDKGSPIVLLPYGGTHLSRIEHQFFTPSRKLTLAAVSCAAVLITLTALIVPTVHRNGRWEEVELFIGRGQIDAALSMLEVLGSRNEGERARRVRLFGQVVDRLLERNEPQPAVEVLLKMAPATAEERAARTKELLLTVDKLLDKGDFESATRLIESFEPANPSDASRLFDARVRLARGLLARGRLDELAAQADALLAANPKSPLGHVMKGHLHYALADRLNPYTNLTAALSAYEKALSIELSAAEDELLVRNVVAVYNNAVEDAKKRSGLIEKADSLISRFIGPRATPALFDQLSKTSSGSAGRSWIVDRLRRLGADKNVDQEMLLVQDLFAKACEGRNADAAKKLLYRLRDEGGPRAVGHMLRYGQQYPECVGAVTEAVERIVGERVVVLPAKEVQLEGEMAALRTTSCKSKRDVEQAGRAIAALAGAGEARGAGELLRFAARNPSCADVAVAAARGLLGSDGLTLKCPPAPVCPAVAETEPKAEPKAEPKKEETPAKRPSTHKH
jgi:class 3 adenylate cyclase/tetratricopeptide (TPR) repeat protein